MNLDESNEAEPEYAAKWRRIPFSYGKGHVSTKISRNQQLSLLIQNIDRRGCHLTSAWNETLRQQRTRGAAENSERRKDLSKGGGWGRASREQTVSKFVFGSSRSSRCLQFLPMSFVKVNLPVLRSGNNSPLRTSSNLFVQKSVLYGMRSTALDRYRSGGGGERAEECEIHV